MTIAFLYLLDFSLEEIEKGLEVFVLLPKFEKTKYMKNKDGLFLEEQ